MAPAPIMGKKRGRGESAVNDMSAMNDMRGIEGKGGFEIKTTNKQHDQEDI